MNKLEIKKKKKMVMVVTSGWNVKELGSHMWWKHEWVFFVLLVAGEDEFGVRWWVEELGFCLFIFVQD